jgi:anti-sigma factor RsiW
VLEGDDQARFEAHAARCERCRVIVRLDRQALRQLSLASAPEMDPSPDFKQRLMQRAAAELAERGRAEPTPIQLRPRPAKVIPLWRRAWVTALAAVFVLGISTLGVLTYMNQVVATYALSGGGVPGTASVVIHRSGQAELRMEGVPDPGQGFVYEAWIIAQGQRPVAAGTLPSGQGSVDLRGNVRGTTVAVTKEALPVPDQPSSQPLMATVVQS